MTQAIVNPKTLSFTPPTLNTDGSAVTPGEIDSYIVEVGVLAPAGTPQTYPITFTDTAVTPGADGSVSASVASLGSLADGDYAGVVVAHTAQGIVSAVSNSATFSVVTAPPPPPVPNPCTNFTFA